MPEGIIGHTGFVGRNLLRQHAFDDFYNSGTIERIRGKSYSLLVISGAPAAKWIANREPENDLNNMNRLLKNLEEAKADLAVLISTIDVYPDPLEVDETTPIDRSLQHPYGKHRLILEDFVRDHFPISVTLRLPGLFGQGLKKNAVYDFLHDNETDKIHCDSAYQWYCLENLWSDIRRIIDAELTLVNMATEPVSIGELAREAFGFEFTNRPHDRPARYDFRTRHFDKLAGHNGYLYDRTHIMGELKEFVSRERRSPTS